MAVVTVLLVGATTAVAVNVADNDDRWSGRGGAMMMSDRDDRPHRNWQPGWHGPGPMMPGGMHGIRVSSEDAYLAEMVAHHEEAVAAARELRRSPRARIREFGAAIVASQSAQIDQMQQWLADWYPNRTDEVNYEPTMRDLTRLSGQRLDRVFLQDMTRHHMAAVMMSQRLLARGLAEHDEVAALARTIRSEQHDEIFQMRRWLRDWFGYDWQHSPRGSGWRGMHSMGGPRDGGWSGMNHGPRDSGWNGMHGTGGPRMMR
ncbi:DUF305 domain-containing protein [Nocardioides seonyuensis]|uniref:DUF305 domain-containing protein n=1 Tax=Nocardioides seonyuensis TaxID=2518371 RepID=UPI00142054A7|nr:DUF305 domain-containing protein [Nocardioides seonyuensis]